MLNFCGFIQSMKLFCFFFTVDDYNVDEPLESSYDLLPGIRKAMQVSLTVVVDRTFALGGVDLRACFFIDHCCVNFTFTCFFFFFHG